MSGPEPAAVVRTSSPRSGNSLHVDDPDSTAPAPACRSDTMGPQCSWRRETPTDGLLAFKRLCRFCFPATRGRADCGRCGAVLTVERTAVDGQYLQRSYTCPDCNRTGQLVLDPATGECVRRTGVARNGADAPDRAVLTEGHDR